MLFIDPLIRLHHSATETIRQLTGVNPEFDGKQSPKHIVAPSQTRRRLWKHDQSDMFMEDDPLKGTPNGAARAGRRQGA